MHHHHHDYIAPVIHDNKCFPDNYSYWNVYNYDVACPDGGQCGRLLEHQASSGRLPEPERSGSAGEHGAGSGDDQPVG